MDPLSITAGIFAILSSSIRICVDIQSLRSGAAVADTAVQALFLDVDDFSRVLYLISETLNEDKDHVQATGHAGNLWRNVSCSVEKSQEVMIQLKGVLQRVDKNSNLASGLRKHIRLTAASEEISIYQQQIRTYRDTLQLSMHSIIIFKQSSLQGTVRMILPSLDLLHREFHKTQKEIMYLQTLMHSQQKDSTGDISNLRDTLRSAAEVASSASTIFIERDDTDKLSVVLDSITAQSELGDLLGQESELTQRWIFSNNSHSDQDFESRTAISGDPQVITVGPSERCQVENASLSRTTTDLDCMMIQALFHQGKTCFLAKDLGLAKRLLRRCMLEYEQIPGVEVPQVDRDEVSDLLLEIWLEQKDWDEAETMLKQRLNRMSDNANGLENATVVRYSLALAEVLFAKKIPVEAKLYGRKALQRYLSLGSNGVHGAEKALRLLIQICHSNEDIEDEEAYTAMLSFVQKQVAESTKDETSDVDSQATLGPTGPQHSVINMEKSTRRDEGTRVIRNPKPKSTPLPAIHLDINESIHAGRVIPETNGARKTRFPGITYMDNVDYTRDFESDGGYRDQFGHSLCESRRKLVFVGDCCGKSSLILTYLKGAWFPSDWPNNSFFTIHPIYQEVNGKTTIFELWDTQSQDGYDRIRPLCYPDCDIVLIGIAIDSLDSLDNVRERYINEVRHFLKTVPIILVGLLKDKRYDPKTIEELSKTSQHPVTFDEGKQLCGEIGAVAYLECSAVTGEGVSEVFEMASRVALQGKTKSRTAKDCLVM